MTEMNMQTDAAEGADARERLSALVDGELAPDGVASGCASWRDDAEVRVTWHSYQLIGDVLRSEDLASDPARDLAFMNAFRERLATEPVVLAPQPSQPAESGVVRVRRRAWMGPAAVAAGFVAVAGVLVLTRSPVVSTEAPALALTGTSAGAGAMAASATVVAAVPTSPAPAVTTTHEPQALVASGQLIRDARLDRYLAAHKQFAGSSALGVPSGFLRSATADASDR